MIPVGKAMSFVTNVENMLFVYAVKQSDGFRQWFYPHLPNSYAINPAAQTEALELYATGYDWRSAADEIYSTHA